MRQPVSLVRVDSYTDSGGRLVSRLKGPLHKIPKHDRPPRLIIEHLPAPRRTHLDASPTRRALPQRYPGRPIQELHNPHLGEGACAILHNGPSLSLWEGRLGEIQVPLIGMNRAVRGYVGVLGAGYSGPQPDYYCFVDHPWAMKPEVLAHPKVVNGSTLETDPSKGRAYRVTRSYRMAPFSFDLARDGFVGLVPCSTGFLALQLAWWLGFRRAYLVGLDLSGGHFDGTNASTSMPDAVKHYEKMAERLQALEGPDRFEVLVCGSPNSLVRCFPHVSFEALLEERPLLAPKGV